MYWLDSIWLKKLTQDKDDQDLVTQVTPEIIALTLWYSVAAVGIAIVNDFKSVEGDLVRGC